MKEKILSLTKKDFEVQTFKAGGKGGQHQNKTDSGVRIIHRDSGAVGEGRSEKSQKQNKKLAFQRLTKHSKFKIWLNKRVHEITGGKTIEQRVEDQMDDRNIKAEIKDEQGRWIENG